MIASRADEIRLAFTLLSRLPVGRIAGPLPSMAATVWAWPLVGIAVGSIMAATSGFAVWIGMPPIMVALLAIAAGTLATGAMHEDGLADVADGFGGGRDRLRKLEIMRDSRIGSFGVVALVIAFGIRVAGIETLIDAGMATYAFIAVAAASRAFLPAALAFMPAAREDGLGQSASGDDPVPAIIAASSGFLCLLPLGLGSALVVYFVMALSVVILAGVAMRQIGGQTGDVMGAMQQTAEIAGWIALSALV